MIQWVLKYLPRRARQGTPRRGVHMTDAQPRPRWLSLLAFVVTASCVLPVTPAAPAEGHWRSCRAGGHQKNISSAVDWS